MRHQLQVCKEMIRQKKVFGVVILGICLMDLDWEANKALHDWLDERGDVAVQYLTGYLISPLGSVPCS